MTKDAKVPTPLKDKILAERAAGNIVFWGAPGELMTAKLDDFIKQPVDGMLYDLNRLEEVTLTFLDDPKWVNDFAVALVIRKLVTDRDEARRELLAAQSAMRWHYEIHNSVRLLMSQLSIDPRLTTAERENCSQIAAALPSPPKDA